MSDLFASGSAAPSDNYDASAIEVLEGLEPVRRRPGMYIGGTDARALHHLAAEVIDNSMDEAVAGHASRIEVTLEPGNRLTVSDNGRGIPVDPHPKYPGKSALEVILTTLHSGGKFEGKAYSTSGGLHGVGVSASSTRCRPRPSSRWRARRSSTARASPGASRPRRSRKSAPRPTAAARPLTFTPDPDIFGDDAAFSPERLYKLARSKAYLFAGVEIRWRCDPSLASDSVPEQAVFQFPGGLADHLARAARRTANASPRPPSPAGRTSPTGRARPNGRSPGRCGARAATKAIIATPSRRPTAARMRRAFAPR